MTIQTFSLFLFLIIFSSCEFETGNDQQTINENKINIDTSKVNYITSILNNGHILFKKNCAVCHCSPHSSCDSYSGFRFENIFNKLPKDSLDRYIRFVSDSKKSNLKYTAESEHKFETKLNEKEIETIVEYLWLECRPRN